MTLTQLFIKQAIETGVPIQHLLQQIDLWKLDKQESVKLKLEYINEFTIQRQQWEVQNEQSWTKARNH